jgi:hypothetical protein
MPRGDTTWTSGCSLHNFASDRPSKNGLAQVPSVRSLLALERELKFLN